jgi:hypothetical protein
MYIIKKIGITSAVLGGAGILAPSIGIVFKGTQPSETRMAGLFLLALGLVLLAIGFALGKLQDSLERRADTKARPTLKKPDDLIK